VQTADNEQMLSRVPFNLIEFNLSSNSFDHIRSKPHRYREILTDIEFVILQFDIMLREHLSLHYIHTIQIL
jgi:hypothetical protein